MSKPHYKERDTIEKHFPGIGNMLIEQIEEYSKAIESMTWKRGKLWELLNGLAKASDMVEDVIKKKESEVSNESDKSSITTGVE